MIGLAVLFLVLLVVFGVAIALTLNLIGLLLYLFIAGAVGWAADAIVPGELPFGWLGAIAAGLLGSLLGRLIIGPWGPNIFGIHVIPALVGAIILAFVADLVFKQAAPSDTAR
jgi:uncharacterized membrane protein YeaQ/YmgE (transglycosylase-associated protein family)